MYSQSNTEIVIVMLNAFRVQIIENEPLMEFFLFIQSLL